MGTSQLQSGVATKQQPHLGLGLGFVPVSIASCTSCPTTLPQYITLTQTLTSLSSCTIPPRETVSTSCSPLPPLECDRERDYLILFIIFLILFVIFLILFIAACLWYWRLRKRCRCLSCGMMAYECACPGGPTLGGAAPPVEGGGEYSGGGGGGTEGEAPGEGGSGGGGGGGYGGAGGGETGVPSGSGGGYGGAIQETPATGYGRAS
ncbi:hypothetical protein ONS95_013748 [Cadophora gregata]|uniref:uncharacterized protein n=1 Tax=Cadophora gregata TaxID=51156 RepID=UPI0026DC7643|nr:uncharacterized protein ONS95_013748 [Cadophora gregata]KAK0114250.1 hypothetical protein ONS95_013748 [Cadophora gregata]